MSKLSPAGLTLLGAVAAFACVTLRSPATAQPAGPRAAWEYKVVALSYGDSTDGVQNTLNELGAAGWEVVASTSQPKGGASLNTDAKVILKRPRR